jgi:hypothetical protein
MFVQKRERQLLSALGGGPRFLLPACESRRNLQLLVIGWTTNPPGHFKAQNPTKSVEEDS